MGAGGAEIDVVKGPPATWRRNAGAQAALEVRHV
jgi:hypothetical protein